MNTNNRDSESSELDDIRLTAYALGQLHEHELAAVEAQLAALEPESAHKLRRTVEEIRGLAGHVSEAFREEPSPQPSPTLRAAVERRLSQLEDSPMARTEDPSSVKSRPWHRRPWLALAAAACLLIAAIPLGFVVVASATHRSPREVAMNDEKDVLRSAEERAKNLPEEVGVQLEKLEFDSFAEEAVKRQAFTELETADVEMNKLRGQQDRLGAALVQSQAQASVVLRGTPEAVRELKATLDADAMSALPGGGKDYDPAAPPPEPPVVYPSAEVWRQLTGGRLDRYEGQQLSVREEEEAAGGYGGGMGFGAGGMPGGGEAPGMPGASGMPGGGAGAGMPGMPGMPGPGMMPGMPGGTGMRAGGGMMGGYPGMGPMNTPDANLGGAGHGASYSYYGTVAPAYPGDPGGMGMGGPPGMMSGQVWGRPIDYSNPMSVPGTEQYDAIVENEFLPVGARPLSTFSIDVDTASYANVRRFLSEGRLPPPSAVRIEEMVNYFQYDYPQPQDEAPFSVQMEVAQCPWNGEHRLLRVGLKGRQIDRDQRGPTNLVFLLDVSGSMADENKLPLVKQAMRLLVDQLTEDDRVAIVTYAGTAGVKLESTNGENKQEILDAVDSLSAGGSTHGSAGIQLAYEQAGQHFLEEGTNRVILATDGDLNVGITDDDALVKLIQNKARSGVFLTVLGFGTGNLKDSKMEKLADHGNGTYAYVDNLREARKVLVEQIAGSLVTIAKDVKLQIEFNPAEAESYRLIGYENRVLAARDFDDDKKDAGEIGAGHTVTALYELVPAGDEPGPNGESPMLKYQRVPQKPPAELTDEAHSGELLTLRLRYKEPDGEESKLLEFVAKDSERRFGEASPDFQFAAAVASFGMVLRGSQYAGDLTLAAVEEFAVSGVGNDPGGYRAEFVDLVRRARQLSPR